MDSDTLRSVQVAQRLTRGFIARRRVQKFKSAKYRQEYQQQFETTETLYKYKFEQIGAAVKIQHWARNFRSKNKIRWHKKFAKLLEKVQREKVVRRIVRRNAGFDSSKKRMNTPAIYRIGVVIVLQRIVRGFLGKRRFKRFKAQKYKEIQCIVRMQALARRFLVRKRYPDCGKRSLMLVKRKAEWRRKLKEEAQVKAQEKKRKLRLKNSEKFTKTVRKELTDDEIEAEALQSSTYRFHRRASILFINMKIGDLDRFELLEKSALVIQCAWYRKRAYRRVNAAKNIVKFGKAIRLQRWLSTAIWRRKLRRIIEHIKPIWVPKARRIKLRHRAAITIQSNWRTVVKVKWLKFILYKRRYLMARIVKWIRYRQHVHRNHRRVLQRRHDEEMSVSGRLRYQYTELRWLCFNLWSGIKKKKYDIAHEMQKLFASYALNGNLESTKFVKMMKDCTGLIVQSTKDGDNISVTLNNLELHFTKIKAPNEKRIDYLRFLDLIQCIAIMKFLRVDASKATAPVVVPGPNSGEEPPELTPQQLSVQNFKYGGMTGRTALILRFFLTYFVTIPSYETVLLTLGPKSAQFIAAAYVKAAVTTLQTFVINRLTMRKLTVLLAKQVVDRKERRRSSAASKIQAGVRAFLGRRFIMKMAQKLYQKFVDGESERQYWYNIRTDRSFWTKPLLLGKLDCGMATRMPKEEEQYSIFCRVCTDTASDCYCLDCREPQCMPCYASSHRAGNRKKHTEMAIDNCIQCEFQVGVRYCATCKDLFCDSCYKYLHRKGRLRYHVYSRMTSVCEHCEDRSARWKEIFSEVAATMAVSSKKSSKLTAGMSSKYSSKSGKSGKSAKTTKQLEQIGRTSKLWCNVCYFNEYLVRPQEMESEWLQPVIYFGKSVTDYFQKKEEAARALDIQEKFERRKEELRIEKYNLCVLTIQRVIRGCLSRMSTKQFIKQRTEFMRLRAEEEKKRQSLWYKLTDLLGAGPKLQSDTPLERVMKSYPRYMHHILTECVENKWNDACRLITEHEEHLEGCPKSNVLQRMLAKVRHHWSKQSLEKATEVFKEKEALYGTMLMQYRNAETAGLIAPSKMKAKQEALKKMKGELTLAETKKTRCEDKVEEARTRLHDTVGPRGLQTLIRDKMKHGVMLPFKVSIRKHSRLALVGWEMTPEIDPDEEQVDEYGNPVPVAPQYNFQPGRWKERLAVGDLIMVRGITFKIIRPPPKAPPKTNKIKKTTSGDNSNSKGDDSSKDNSTSLTKSKKSTGMKDTSESEAVELSEMLEASESKFDKNFDKELVEEATDDHIMLDRPWLLDDVYGIEIFKAVPKVFYMKPLFLVQRMAQRTYPVQKFVAVAAVTNYKLSKLYTRVSDWFDDESPSRQQWLADAQKKMVQKDRWLSLSRSVVQMSFDFTLRRVVFRFLRIFYRIFAAMFNAGKSIYKTVNSGAKEAPYEFWQRSLTKTDVVFYLDLEGPGDAIRLGEVKMDTAAPVDVMREYVRRNFREELNKTVGDSFLFYRHEPKSELCLKEDEYKTYSRDYAPMTMDNKTMVSAMTAVVKKDPTRGRMMIPEFKKDEEEEDAELEKLLKH